jgi:hypothetical protein
MSIFSKIFVIVRRGNEQGEWGKGRWKKERGRHGSRRTDQGYCQLRPQGWGLSLTHNE